MRLELRNDETVACTTCGVTAPILTGGFGDPLETDLTGAFERSWARREAELTSLFLVEREEARVSWEQVIRDEVAAAKAGVERAHVDYVQAVEALAAVRARRWRVLKRRWQRQLEDDVTAATFALREATRRA